MKYFEIDLYDYYKVKKPENGRALLHCYVAENNAEIDINRKHPAMLVLPGGAYAICSFREAEPVCQKYFAYGFNTFYLDYSVTPIHYPYQLTEAVMAINYIRERSEELNVDKNKVSAVGFSAGGHLCATLGSLFDCEEVKKIFTPTENTRPDAVILSYPVITSGEKGHKESFYNLCGNNEQLIEKLDIGNCVNERSAPAFIWATRDDNLLEVKNSLVVANAYEKYGLPFALHIYGKGWHGLSVADKTVYPNDDYKACASVSVGDWVKYSVEWLNELGLYNI